MGFGLDGGHLNEAGVEQHVEHEGDDASGEDDLLSLDEDGSWTVGNFINCDEKNPVGAEEYHDNDKLGSEGVGEAIVPDDS